MQQAIRRFINHLKFLKYHLPILCLVLILCAGTIPAPAQAGNGYTMLNSEYATKVVDGEGNELYRMITPIKPPEIKVAAVELPRESMAGALGLGDVPAFDWSYGCSATSAAMMFGYYDRTGYSSMYTGPTNGGVSPLNNSAWGEGECPISATHDGIDGRATRGHVDDYWSSYGSAGPDPYVTNGWTEHSPFDSTADFMGTNQWKYTNTDGSTSFYFYTNGDPLSDYTGSEPGDRDGCHGMRLFAESRGYTVLANYSQLIQGEGTNPALGFTFANYCSEIDAGRPVLIQVDGHTMLGDGYNTTGSLVYLHDTWDYSSHEMTWGGSYSSMVHYGVTVLQLAPAGPPSDSVSITAGPAASPSTIASAGTTNLSVSASDSLGHSLTYNWSVLSSPLGDGSFSSATTQNPTWTAPANSTGVDQTVQLKVQATCSNSQVAEGTVNVTVQPSAPPPADPPILNLPSPNLDFGTSEEQQALIVRNEGGADLHWTATSPANWISASAASGTIGPHSEIELQISVSRAGKSPAVYQTEIAFSSDGGNQTAGVQMEVPQPQPQPTIDLLNPDGGESWTVGESRTIQWSSANLLGDVKIELSRNGGSAWETLFADTANDGSQSWTVTGPVSTACRVRVTSINDGAVLDTSNANFAIESAVHEFTLHLLQNWNMVSLPLTTSPSPSAVFGGLPAGWMIFSWNPLIPGYVMNDQVTLEVGKGYWLKSPSALNYVVSGAVFNQLKTVPLAVGWNMVGLPYLEDANWDDVHIRAGGVTYTLDQAADAGIIARYLFWWNGSQYQIANDVGKLEPGKGYWLQAKQSCELLFSPGGVTPPPPPPGNP